MKIGNRELSLKSDPMIVAEMSGNHNQSLDRAFKIIKATKESGVDAVKIQTYTADTITIDKKDKEFIIGDSDSLWKGKSLYDLYKEAYTPWEWHKPIMDKCKEYGLICFSTPFDISAVEFLEKLDVPCYKIASFEIIDIPLIKEVAKTKKPVIISTGMASLSEIYEAVEAVKSQGNNQIVLLKCNSAYPAPPQYSNLLTIPNMRQTFGVEVGLSDHTLGIGVAITAIALGAVLIEKHFTLNRSEGGVDSAFSIEPNEMKMLVEESKKAYASLGKVFYGPNESEISSLKHRRSIYAVEDIKAGEKFTNNNIKSIRPALGLPPKYLELLIGKTAKKDIKKGEPIGWDMVL